jgi:hypothetical protein
MFGATSGFTDRRDELLAITRDEGLSWLSRERHPARILRHRRSTQLLHVRKIRRPAPPS